MDRLTLRNREIDQYGRISFDEDGLISLLKKGKTLNDVSVMPGEWVENYQAQCDMTDERCYSLSILKHLDISVEEFDQHRQRQWFVPDYYKNLDLIDYLMGKCSTLEEQERVAEEWIVYEDRNLINLLKLMVYMVDVFRENKIVWGVGRGSSVSSYILYLIGVHKINSIKYGLDFSEFLK